MVEKLKSAELTFKELQLKMGDPEVAGESHTSVMYRLLSAPYWWTGVAINVGLTDRPTLRAVGLWCRAMLLLLRACTHAMLAACTACNITCTSHQCVT